MASLSMKRPAEPGSAGGGEQIAKKPLVLVDARLASGDSLVQLEALASTTGDELKAEITKHVGPGKIAQGLVFNASDLGSMTLTEAGLADDGSPQVVSVVVGALPTLYMFKPCSAAEVAKSYVEQNDFGEVECIPVFNEPVQFERMDKAPAEAQQIAKELSDALGSKITEMFPSPFGGFFEGHVIVISGVGSNLKKTCCAALGGINKSAWDEFPDDEEEIWSSDICTEDLDFSDPSDCPFVNDRYAEELPEETIENARAGQKVMSAKLTKHFLFEFDWDMFKLFPQIYGGFISDDIIVGIMRGRLVDA